MAIKFNQAKGEAQKNKIDSYQYVEGDNVVRMVTYYQDMYTG